MSVGPWVPKKVRGGPPSAVGAARGRGGRGARARGTRRAGAGDAARGRGGRGARGGGGRRVGGRARLGRGGKLLVKRVFGYFATSVADGPEGHYGESRTVRRSRWKRARPAHQGLSVRCRCGRQWACRSR